MKVLFVCSGNSEYKISPIVQNQANSLIKAGIEVDFFPIKGKGIVGYLSNVKKLRKFIKGRKYDIVHAHYYLCGIVASLSGAKPIVVSLMGSDVYAFWLNRFMIRIFAKISWNKVIVKTPDLYRKIKLIKSSIVPNGVDMDVFKPVPKEKVMNQVNFPDGFNIIFVADPSRKEKNFALAEKAVNLLDNTNIHLHKIYKISVKDLVNYYNAADLLLLTSLWEGSPNVIKEAMACNCPIISTKVGDVNRLLEGIEGCYLSSYDPGNIASQIRKSLEFGGKTTGRNKIIQLGLDSETVAKEIIKIYKSSIN